MNRPKPWSHEEDQLIVKDYLAMLALQKEGKPVNKSATRRALLPQLNQRSEASIEFKRCNISAVLQDLQLPYLTGYKPRDNYQSRLADIVKQHLS